GVRIERGHRTADQLDLLPESRGALAEERTGRLACKPLDRAIGADAAAAGAVVDVDAVLAEMVDAGEVAAHAERPGDRRALDPEDALDFVQQLDRRAPVAVELVDEGHDGRVTQPADLHQLDGALLD